MVQNVSDARLPLKLVLPNWLTAEQGETLWQSPDAQRRRGKRDRALLAVLLACGLRRHEAVDLNFLMRLSFGIITVPCKNGQI
jgi:site-specific recombinase XerD